MPKLLHSIKEIMTNRRYILVAAFVVFTVGLLTVLTIWFRSDFLVSKKPAEDTPSSVQTVDGAVMNKSLPVRITIPAAHIDAKFSEPLGLDASGQVQVPKDYVSVGYYKNGPTPGELGPAVVLGHVDSYQGPAVFFSLGQVKEGDEIRIERADGTIAVFSVTKLERHEQSDFPTKDVYGDINFAGLRLITCTGIYNHSILRYSHNLIVYAKLTGVSSAAINE